MENRNNGNGNGPLLVRVMFVPGFDSRSQSVEDITKLAEDCKYLNNVGPLNPRATLREIIVEEGGRYVLHDNEGETYLASERYKRDNGVVVVDSETEVSEKG